MKLNFAKLIFGLALYVAASSGVNAATEDLLSNNNSTATAQSLGNVGTAIDVFGVRGTINFFGATVVDDDDADYYSFFVSAHRVITLRVDTPEGAILEHDPMVGLYSDAGLQLAVDDDSGPGNDSILSYSIERFGIYFAAVSGFRDENFNGISDFFEHEGTGNSTPRTNFLYHLQISAAPVPVPAASWLFGAGLLCAAKLRKRIRA